LASRSLSRDVHARQAHRARGQLERALDIAGWPYSSRLSFWIDVLIAIEEAAWALTEPAP
jgi:hypothetical protein